MHRVGALIQQGMRQHQAGRLRAARQRYGLAVRQCPDHPEAHHLLGLVSHQLGRHESAVEHIRKAIGLRPTDAAYHNNLGEVYRTLGRHELALTCVRAALDANPQFAEAHDNLGNVLFELGHDEQAERCYRTALEMKRDIAPWHNNLGNALLRLQKADEAIACYRTALELDPKYWEAYNTLAMALRYRGDLSEAERILRQCQDQCPSYVMAMNNLAIVLKEQGRLSEAEIVLQRAICQRRDFVEAYDTLGIVRLAQGRIDDAVAKFDDALAINPSYAQSHFNRALTWLAAGDYERGWREFEWRFEHDPTLKLELDGPRWDGHDLAGKTILLYAEQGLGDTIMFIRFATLAAARGARVLFECQPALKRLLRDAPSIDTLIARGQPRPDFDVHAPLLSMPLTLNCQADTLAHSVPYLVPEPKLCRSVRKHFLRHNGLRVGINWQGNPKFCNDRFRSMPLLKFAPLTKIPGVHVYSMQHGEGHEQVTEIPPEMRVVDLGARLDEEANQAARPGEARQGYRMALAAAAICELDLIITTDTMLAHLAGALGRPVWVLLSSAPDWRWQYTRSDNAWYPSMRVFRQRSHRDWNSAVQQVQIALYQFMMKRRAA